MSCTTFMDTFFTSMVEMEDSINRRIEEAKVGMLLARIRKSSIGYAWISRRLDHDVYRCMHVHSHANTFVQINN